MNNNGKYELVKDYSVAPYNFVSLPDRAIAPYKSIEELPKHDELNDKLLNGFIEYEITNKTPLIIAEGSSNLKESFKNSYKINVIPGSTLKGIIANNTAILSLSNITDYIEDENFLYRDIASVGSTNKDYKKRLNVVSKNVDGRTITAPFTMKAGYIYKVKKDEYKILPAKEINEQSYFRISEQYLRKINVDNKEINYMYNKDILDLINKKEKYKNKRDKDFFLREIGTKNKYGKEGYKPYYTKVSFNLKGKRSISKIGRFGEYSYDGYIMSSEKINGKLSHYIIPMYEKEDSSEDIIFNKEKGNLKYINFYKEDCIRTKKQHSPLKIDEKKDRTYFLLPEKCGIDNGKPLFYGEFNGKYCFGFSPYVRIPYDNSIYYGINNEYKNSEGISYLESIFGFTNKKIEGKKVSGYKSRVSFEDAILQNRLKNQREYNIVAGNPMATAYNLYLKQDMDEEIKNLKNYNSEDFKIRGIKEYWPRALDSIQNLKVENKNLNIKIKPIPENNKFKGKIKFKNLKEEELGLLLWALKVDEKAYETIGLGKPYGFGTVCFNEINIFKEDTKKKYSSMINDCNIKLDKDKLIKKYKDYILEKYKINLDNQLSIKEFKEIKTTLIDGKNRNEVRYMSLNPKNDYKIYGKNEFRFKLPLPSAIEFNKILNGDIKIQRKESNNKQNNRNKKYNNKKNNKRG